MRLTICLTAALALSVSSAEASAHPAHAKASFQLDGTTWTYSMKDVKYKESIDADGKYITQTLAGKHFDHGTAVMKDGKACFTSAMTKDGQICWSVSPVAIGHRLHSVNDKGDKLTVTRVAYTPMQMPH